MYRFVTEYSLDAHLYGGSVDATDWAHARMICDQRAQGEAVVGQLYAVVKAAHWTCREANEFMKRLSESFIVESPQASEFDVA